MNLLEHYILEVHQIVEVEGYPDAIKVDLTYSFRTSSVSNKNGTKMWVTSSLDSSWIMYLVGAQNTWTTSPYAAGPFVWTLDDQDNDKAISYTTYIQDKFGDPIKNQRNNQCSQMFNFLYWWRTIRGRSKLFPKRRRSLCEKNLS